MNQLKIDCCLSSALCPCWALMVFLVYSMSRMENVHAYLLGQYHSFPVTNYILSQPWMKLTRHFYFFFILVWSQIALVTTSAPPLWTAPPLAQLFLTLHLMFDYLISNAFAVVFGCGLVSHWSNVGIFWVWWQISIYKVWVQLFPTSLCIPDSVWTFHRYNSSGTYNCCLPAPVKCFLFMLGFFFFLSKLLPSQCNSLVLSVSLWFLW